MSWTRAGQLSAETRSLADVSGLTGPTGATISSAEKYTGNYSYRFSGDSQPIGIAGLNATAARAHLFFRHNGIWGSGFAPLVGMLVDGAPVVWGLDLFTAEIRLRAGWVSGSSTVRFPVTVTSAAITATARWYSVGMTAFFDENGFVSLWVDGLLAATWEGDTRVFRSGQTTARTTITGCYALGTPSGWMTGLGIWSNYAYVDDFYVDVWGGSSRPTDAAPPSRRFLAAFPNGPGGIAQWTPVGGANWQNVAEAPPDNDATYNRATDAGSVDMVNLANIAVPPDWAVRAVIPMVYARKTDASVDSRIRVLVNNDAGALVGAARPLPTFYGYVWERWAAQADGSAWTEATVNTALMGYESAGDFG